MILGDPYKFSIIIDTIKEWNIDDAFCNGVLIFCVDGNLFPKEIVTATLKVKFSSLRKTLNTLLLMKIYIICKKIKHLLKSII